MQVVIFLDNQAHFPPKLKTDFLKKGSQSTFFLCVHECTRERYRGSSFFDEKRETKSVKKCDSVIFSSDTQKLISPTLKAGMVSVHKS